MRAASPGAGAGSEGALIPPIPLPPGTGCGPGAGRKGGLNPPPPGAGVGTKPPPPGGVGNCASAGVSVDEMQAIAPPNANTFIIILAIANVPLSKGAMHGSLS